MQITVTFDPTEDGAAALLQALSGGSQSPEVVVNVSNPDSAGVAASTAKVAASKKAAPKPKAEPKPEPEPEPEPDPEPEPQDEPEEQQEPAAATLEDAVNKATELVGKGRIADVKAALKDLGVGRVSELKPKQYQAFLDAVA